MGGVGAKRQRSRLIAGAVAMADQTIGGQAYVFSGWSDGGAASHDILISGNATLTATVVRASP